MQGKERQKQGEDKCTNADKGRQMHEIDATTLIAKDSEGWFSNSAVLQKRIYNSNVNNRMLGVSEKNWLTQNTIWRKNIAMVGRKPVFKKQYFSYILKATLHKHHYN